MLKKDMLFKVLGTVSLLLIIFFVGFIFIVVYGIPYPENKNSIFPNYYLEKAVREQINKPEGKLLLEDCIGIKELDLSFSDYNTDLEGIQYFTDLEKFTICAGRLADISALANLIELRYLDVSLNEIRDITPLAELRNLETLNLRDNQIEDISPLVALDNLRYLNLAQNNIKNIELLMDKSGLELHRD